VLPFGRRFTGKSADPGLFERIWATELSGVLNRAVAGWRRLHRRGGRFKVPAAVSAATGRWLACANPLAAFLDEACARDDAKSALVQELYDAYRVWARAAGVTATEQRIAFRRSLENRGWRVSRGNRGQKVAGLCLRKAS